jgi:hypothetical protein
VTATPCTSTSIPGRARPADGYQGARREIVGEDLPAELGEPVTEPRIGDEYGHRHQIGKARAGVFERPPEPGEDLADLAVEIGGVACNIDREYIGEPLLKWWQGTPCSGELLQSRDTGTGAILVLLMTLRWREPDSNHRSRVRKSGRSQVPAIRPGSVEH